MFQYFLRTVCLILFVFLGCTVHTFAVEPFDGPPVSIALKDPFVQKYYNVYKEILLKVKKGELNEDQFYADDVYVSMTMIGGEIDLTKIKLTDSNLDLSEAKVSGFKVPYEFFYYVSYESTTTADIFISKLAVYSALLDLQACHSAVKRVKSRSQLVNAIEAKYRKLARIYGTIDKERLQNLLDMAKVRHFERLRVY